MLAERLRITTSWIAIVVLAIMALGVQSYWQASEVAEECFNSAALLLVTIGCLGRVWCLVYIAGRKNQELVTRGPYSLCRNPLYLFSLIGAVGVAMATCTFTLPLSLSIGFAGLYWRVILAEETRLARVHGDVYEHYRSMTPCFLPRFRQYKRADQIVLDVRSFQAGLIDAGWFLLAILGAHLVTELHEAGYRLVTFRLV